MFPWKPPAGWPCWPDSLFSTRPAVLESCPRLPAQGPAPRATEEKGPQCRGQDDSARSTAWGGRGGRHGSGPSPRSITGIRLFTSKTLPAQSRLPSSTSGAPQSQPASTSYSTATWSHSGSWRAARTQYPGLSVPSQGQHLDGKRWVKLAQVAEGMLVERGI